MQEIDHFSEEKMEALAYKNFSNALPPGLKSKFLAASNNSYPLAVVQGYKGPSRLRKPGSTDTEEEYLGVQRICFWYAASKHINWVPLVGNVIFAAGRIVQSVSGNTDWGFLYFDANTGEMLDVKVAEELMEKNKKAEENYQEGDKLYLKEKYEEAFKKFEFAFENCTTGYKNQKTFKDALDKAQTMIVTQLYKDAGDLIQENQYEKALELYKKVAKLSKDPKEKQKSSDKQALTLIKIGDQLRSNGSIDEAMQKLIEAHGLTKNEEIKHNIDDSIALIYAKEGENFFHDGKYKEAKLKFEQASSKTQKSHDAESFNFWIERIKNELEVVSIKDQADLFLNNKNYEQAVVKYRQAMQKTLLDNEKQKFESKIHDIERKLKDLNVSHQITEEQRKNRAYDLVTEGQNFIIDGYALCSDNEIGAACQKYDEAMKMFEEAAKIHSMNVIFNSILKLIDAYNKVQSFEDALKIIDKGKSLCPNKEEVFNQIKQKINSRDCSLDYLKRLMMEEERKNENQGHTTQNLNF